ncbi:3-oxoacyl-[acyl-carrier protein] reductase [Halovenus aranensis]|uniref:3-oxoacyl-[acyl-carrier protein] reductase n=1 Tax=Halovenus aranensis TaxID=890420 RepID=A0A1G8VWD0_9EURY|nr:SDR family NAD(P)-dependent oxidoreductase [Halovenus aranensis]SDJ70117.1 3-oxoacyl-[acyl-carrier protein] reductase [Halovenus aranensis]
MGVRDRIAIVTGGASGIGEGIASVLSEKGATVVIADVDGDAAEQTAADLPGEAMAVKVDVTDPAETAALAEIVAEDHGQIDILCANAGIFPSASFEDLTVEDWDEVFGVNAKSVFLT